LSTDTLMYFNEYYRSHADYILASLTCRDLIHFAGRVFCLQGGTIIRVTELENDCAISAYCQSRTKAEWIVLYRGWVERLANKMHGIEREALLRYTNARLARELEEQIDSAAGQLVDGIACN
jgi:hypothetical protein